MSPEFHSRPTSPVPPARYDGRVARPMVAGPLAERPIEPPPARVARPLDAPALPTRPRFPKLTFSTLEVNAKTFAAPGTRLWAAVGTVGAAAAVLAAAASTAGLALLGLLFAPVVDYFRERRLRVLLNGSALRVSAQQLPELHACVDEFAARLALPELPLVFVVEHHTANAFSTRLGKKQVVLLTDDLVWGALSSKAPRALGFVVAHELAHIALGHTGTFRSIMRAVVKPLARLDELSADNVAQALVDDDSLAFEGVKLLAVGPQLAAYVDDAALIAQANEVAGSRLAKKVERGLSHPLVMRRVANVLG